jgi:hypothetical protein
MPLGCAAAEAAGGTARATAAASRGTDATRRTRCRFRSVSTGPSLVGIATILRILYGSLPRNPLRRVTEIES